MQRKATKRSTRAANANEKRFMAWVKQQPCCECGAEGPSIVDHMYGSAFIHNKVLIGHWAILPYCQDCDSVKTNGGRGAYFNRFNHTQCDKWFLVAGEYESQTREKHHYDLPVGMAIFQWGR